jgi:hypothetical protein
MYNSGRINSHSSHSQSELFGLLGAVHHHQLRACTLATPPSPSNISSGLYAAVSGCIQMQIHASRFGDASGPEGTRSVTRAFFVDALPPSGLGLLYDVPRVVIGHSCTRGVPAPNGCADMLLFRLRFRSVLMGLTSVSRILDFDK